MRRWLVTLAGNRRAPAPQRAVAQFFLFQAVRINLAVAAWNTDGKFEQLGGTPSDVDAIAEKAMHDMVGAGPVDEDIRPFHVLVGGAMVRLRDHAERLHALLLRTSDVLATIWHERGPSNAGCVTSIRLTPSSL